MYACSINRIAASEPLRVGLTTNLEAKATCSLNFVSKKFNPKKLYISAEIFLLGVSFESSINRMDEIT